MAFSLIAGSLDTDIAFVGAQNLSFGRPSVYILTFRGPFRQLGVTLGGHGSSRKDSCGSGGR